MCRRGQGELVFIDVGIAKWTGIFYDQNETGQLVDAINPNTAKAEVETMYMYNVHTDVVLDAIENENMKSYTIKNKETVENRWKIYRDMFFGED